MTRFQKGGTIKAFSSITAPPNRQKFDNAKQYKGLVWLCCDEVPRRASLIHKRSRGLKLKKGSRDYPILWLQQTPDLFILCLIPSDLSPSVGSLYVRSGIP